MALTDFWRDRPTLVTGATGFLCGLLVPALVARRAEMPLQGRYPYDVSKSCADLIAQSYAVTYGLPVAISRCANLYGGGDLNWNRLVPGTIRSALRGEAPVVRSDGRRVRDYLF